MKEIIAIVRMNKSGQTRDALAEAGFSSLTAVKVMGRGRSLKHVNMIDKVDEGTREMLLMSMLQGGRLIPKRMLMLVVPDHEVTRAVETIISVNREGHAGDGKIFVLPMLDAMRVRTGESGEAAIL